MIIFRNLFILFTVLFLGLIYYQFMASRKKENKRIANFLKINLLILSLILAFLQKDFIVVGGLALGGRVSVMLLIIVEIVDAIIDIKQN